MFRYGFQNTKRVFKKKDSYTRSAIDISRYIIWYCGENGFSISDLKLQKVLYFVQAEFLVSATA